MTKNAFIKTFIVSISYNLGGGGGGGSLIKVQQKIVNTILWQSFTVSQTPVFCKEFGSFLSNTFNKVPLVVFKQVGVLTKLKCQKVPCN